MSRSGSNATTVAERRRPSFVSTSVRGSPATTCALVTTRLAPATKPLPAWIWSHASPWILSTDAETRAATSGASARVGGAPTPPGPLSRENTSGNGPSATARPRRWACGGGSGAYRLMVRTTCESRDEHAEHADDGAADTIAPVQALARRKAATKRHARRVAECLPSAGEDEEEQQRHEQPRLRRLRAQRTHHVVDERDREHDADGESRPGHDAGDEAQAVAEVSGGNHRRDGDDVE